MSNNDKTINEKAVELLPCPFCGSAGTMIHPMGDWQPGGYGPNGSRIVCSNAECCGLGKACYGPDQDAEAIAAWNTRAALSTLPPDEDAPCEHNWVYVGAIMGSHENFRCTKCSVRKSGPITGWASLADDKPDAAPAPAPNEDVGKLVERACGLHRRMLTAYRKARPYSARMTISLEDADIVLAAAIAIERAALSQLPATSVLPEEVAEEVRKFHRYAEILDADETRRQGQPATNTWAEGFRKAVRVIERLAAENERALSLGGYTSERLVEQAERRAEAAEATEARLRGEIERKDAALKSVPIPGRNEPMEDFRRRSDEWLNGPYRAALHPEQEGDKR